MKRSYDYNSTNVKFGYPRKRELKNAESKLDEADSAAETDMTRLSNEEVFGRIRAKLHYEEAE